MKHQERFLAPLGMTTKAICRPGRREGSRSNCSLSRSPAANSALASGDIHYVAGVGPNSVAATLRGLPSKAVWFASESLIYTVLARPEFKTLKELRGKRIGLTGLGGTSDVALRIALEAVGENPKDFVIVALGAPQRMSGLENGTIEAALWHAPVHYHA